VLYVKQRIVWSGCSVILVGCGRRSISGGGTCHWSDCLSHGGGGISRVCRGGGLSDGCRNLSHGRRALSCGGSMCHRTGFFSYGGGGVNYSGSMSRVCCGGGVCRGSDCLSHSGDGVSDGLPVHNGSEAIDGVGGVSL
jgi:hypothetical protein